jgi:hypothetical protein
MSQKEGNDESYTKVKKRIQEYKIRNFFAKFGSFVFALLTIFSFVPLVPIFLTSYFLIPSIFLIPIWIICVILFVWMFIIFQKYDKKIEKTFGITLEEKMFVSAYEALCFLREYLDPKHPILGSKMKVIRRLKDIDYLLNSIEIPNFTIINQETNQLNQLETNLRNRLVPSIAKIQKNNPDANEKISSILAILVDYLTAPKLDVLTILNGDLASLPESNEKGVSRYVTDAVLKRSNARHIFVFSGIAVVSFIASYVDFYYLAASASDAFALGVGSCIEIIAVYAAYLALISRK